MDTYERAKKIAAGLIGYKMYTCHDIYDRLRRKGIDGGVAEQVVSDFAAAGILDDEAYAEAYVSEAVRLSGKGAYRIKQELYQKGIARSIIDNACSGIEEETFAALCEYVESRHLCDGITTRRELEKLKARLARRGFSPSEIRRCLDEYDIQLES